MKDAPTEINRIVEIERTDGQTITVTASPAECAAVAKRLELPDISALRCSFRLDRQSGGVVAVAGELNANVIQICVVSLDPFPVKIQESFVLRFVPEDRQSDSFDPDEDDEIPYSGGRIDLGEATVQQLALALALYPRKPGATLPDSARDDSANPFAKLAKLQRPD